jgi:ubiquitin C-terminal hydrolase
MANAKIAITRKIADLAKHLRVLALPDVLIVHLARKTSAILKREFILLLPASYCQPVDFDRTIST